ncbi:MAG: hypothetical protein WCT77_04095 [Bacteroidota bacterium]
MRLKIVKKSIKEGISNGNPYCIKSLYVNFKEKEVYGKILNHLKEKGVGEDQILKFCKPNEYNGNTTYAFGLNCSDFTFNKVEQFGILDAKIIFAINDKGYINARIQIENKKEQVLAYEAPESNVDGWANGDNNANSAVVSDNAIKVSGVNSLPNEDLDIPF